MAYNETYSTVPITRYTPDDRMLWFEQNAPVIYNKYTPYMNSGIGPDTPLIYNKLTDTSTERYRVRYDTQETPIVSTVVDVRRMGKWLRTGPGIRFLINQNYSQASNAFNETRIYNPLGVIVAASRTGASNRSGPTRHMESNGILSYFVSSFLSTLGMDTTLGATDSPIIGTATGKQGGLAYSQYAGLRGGARAGLIRFPTANNASVKFDYLWSNGGLGGGGGFLANLAKSLIKGLAANIPSTNPMGALGGDPQNRWEYRPEYKTDEPGIFYAMRNDSRGLLKSKRSGENTSKVPFLEGPYVSIAKQIHKYYPSANPTDTKNGWYANTTKVIDENIPILSHSGIGINTTTTTVIEDEGGVPETISNSSGTSLKNTYAKYFKTLETFNESFPIQYRRSAEAYSEVKDTLDSSIKFKTYNDIKSARQGTTHFTKKMGVENAIENKHWFAKASSYRDLKKYEISKDAHDKYNALGIISGKQGQIPKELEGEKNQSRDLIFFYFFDLINEKYVPFRATITSISDQTSGDWEDIQYIGRSDKLFVYKGFSRDVNFSFTVYANSAKEMIPMWNRINYLTGLTRPSKYTNGSKLEDLTTLEGYQARNESIDNELAAINLALSTADQGNLNDAQMAQAQKFMDLSNSRQPTSVDSQVRFIYPPMITFRLGDMFVDQPCVIQSVGVNIPDDTNWETLRADKYEYTSEGFTKWLRYNTGLNDVRSQASEEASYAQFSGQSEEEQAATANKANEITATYNSSDFGASRQLPLKADISVTLKLMEKRQPLTKDLRYGKTEGSKFWQL